MCSCLSVLYLTTDYHYLFLTIELSEFEKKLEKEEKKKGRKEIGEDNGGEEIKTIGNKEKGMKKVGK